MNMHMSMNMYMYIYIYKFIKNSKKAIYVPEVNPFFRIP